MKLKIKVVPGSSQTLVVGWLGDALKIRVAAAPEGGKANNAVIGILATTLNLSKRQIRITSGLSSTRKTVHIDGVDEALIRQKLP